MSKVLSAAEILAVHDRKRELVEVPAWGGSVYVQEISAADAERMADKHTSVIDFCAACIVDEDGNRIFTGDNVAALGEKSPEALRVVMDAISKLNGFTEIDEGKS